MVALDRIAPNPYQPRKHFDELGLEDHTRSIAANGIIQPLVVRPAGDGRFELVAGERRLRAATALGLDAAPVVVRDVPDDRMLELALIENIQRQDLNPIEKAEAFRDFVARYRLTQEQAADRVGIDRATLANHLRLLELPGEIQDLVRAAALGMSHARTLAALPDPAAQMELARRVIRQGWSVRQLEQAVKRLQGGIARRQGGARLAGKSPEASQLEDELRGILGTKVAVEESPRKPGHGRIVIEFYSYGDVDRILGVLRR
jgi:ParB family chromosome partitioning protein